MHLDALLGAAFGGTSQQLALATVTSTIASAMARVLRDVEAQRGADDEHVRGMREGLATVLAALPSQQA